MSDALSGVTFVSFTSIEDAQTCFADVYDGDYQFGDLLRRDDLRQPILYLYGEMVYMNRKPVTRKATFRNADGSVVDVRRPPEESTVERISLDRVVAVVRNGRVEAFRA